MAHAYDRSRYELNGKAASAAAAAAAATAGAGHHHPSQGPHSMSTPSLFPALLPGAAPPRSADVSKPRAGKRRGAKPCHAHTWAGLAASCGRPAHMMADTASHGAKVRRAMRIPNSFRANSHRGYASFSDICGAWFGFGSGFGMVCDRPVGHR